MTTPYDFPLISSYPPGYVNPSLSVNGSAATGTKVKPDRTKDYVSSARPATPGMPRVLDSRGDAIQRHQGPYIYEAMDTDAAVKSAKEALIFSILAGGMDLAPADEPDPGVKDEQRTPDQVVAAELVDEAWRQVERLGDFEAVLRDLLESVKDGVRLARPVLELAASGPDAGKLVLKSLTVKDAPSAKTWQFVVDDFLNVLEIEAASPDADGRKVRYPAEEFLWLTWDMRANNPYGNSEYRAANEPWNTKYLAIPEYYAYLKQFASGKISATTPENPPASGALDPVTGAPYTAQQAMVCELANFANGGIHVGAFGSTVAVHWPSGDGSPFLKGFDWCDRQIHLAILGTTSATLEAEHDSRAKGETGQDIKGLKVERGRKALAAFVRRLLSHLITLNHGEEVARLTPLVTFGQTDPQNRSELWGAAFQGGLTITPSMVPEVCQIVGLPQPDMEADDAAAQAKADDAMARQQAMNPPPPGGPPPPGSGKAAVPPKSKPAEFAYQPPVLPWHDADVIEAQAIAGQAYTAMSIAAFKRWRNGTETAENRRFILEEIADQAKARFTAEGRTLAAELARLRPAATAEFASVFESVAKFRDSIARSLRRYYLAGTLALLGPGDLSQSEWETLRGQTEDQLDYLDGFATRLVDPSNPLSAEVGQNAGLYGQSIKVVASAMERQRAIGAGMTSEKRVHVGDPEDMCKQCKAEQAKKWQPIGTLKPIGSCLCKTGCHCHFEYK